MAKKNKDLEFELPAPDFTEEDDLGFSVAKVIPVIETDQGKMWADDGVEIDYQKYKWRTRSLIVETFEPHYDPISGRSIPRRTTFQMDLPFRTDKCAATQGSRSPIKRSRELIHAIRAMPGYGRDFEFQPIGDDQLEREKAARKDATIRQQLAEAQAEANLNTPTNGVVEKFPSIGALR